MAGVTPFTYRHGRSMLHLLDVRCKFFVICLLGMSMLSAHLVSCFFYGIILFFFFRSSGLKIGSTLGHIKVFILLLFLIFMARAFLVKGDILFSFYGLSITKQGLIQGFLVAFKFFLLMMTGVLFASTTKPALIKSAIQWFLKPVPFIPENRVAVMISLSLAFIPIIASQAKEISDAQKARCGDLQKNPVKKIIRLMLPLLKKTFLCADNLVFAMESRCYNDNRTDPEFHPSGKEVYFIPGSVLLSVGFFCL